MALPKAVVVVAALADGELELVLELPFRELRRMAASRSNVCHGQWLAVEALHVKVRRECLLGRLEFSMVKATTPTMARHNACP